MRLQKGKLRRKNVQKDRTSPTVVLGEPWPYVQVVKARAELAVGSRIDFLFVVVACSAAAVGFFVGERRGDTFNLLSSITAAVLSIAAAGLAYRFARIAIRAGRSLPPEVSERERLHAHETESAILMRALEVFGDSERAIQWMRESNPALKYEPPIRVIQTEDGRREVLYILGRIQHGVIS